MPTFTTHYKQLYAVAIYNLEKQMQKFGGASAPLSTHLSAALKWEPQKVCTFTVLLSTYYEVKILIIAKTVQAALLLQLFWGQIWLFPTLSFVHTNSYQQSGSKLSFQSHELQHFLASSVQLISLGPQRYWQARMRLQKLPGPKIGRWHCPKARVGSDKI